MRKFTLVTLATVLVCIGLLAQGPARVPGDHTKVPPARVPSVYMSYTDIESGLNNLDPKLLASLTGGSVSVGKGLDVVVRRRETGPQYAITHTRTMEYLVILKGSATLVTGGTLIPPTIDTDIYPNTNPNATIRSISGVKDGLAREIGVGDVVVTPPGTPHWLSKINGAIDYVEIGIPNVDPAPGVERAVIAPAPAQ